MDRIFSELKMGLLHRLMDRAAAQERVTSENIANIATPGYRRKHIEFRDMVDQARSEGSSSILATHPRHMTGSERSASGGGAVVREDETDGITAGGANNVDIDLEMAELAATKGAFDIAAEVMKRRFQGLKTAIHGRG